jgi:hypothetical protein
VKEKTPDLGVFFVVSLRLSSNLMLVTDDFLNCAKKIFYLCIVIDKETSLIQKKYNKLKIKGLF